jgi:hypothetical protein
MKAPARLVGPVPGHDHPVELQNLLLEAEQLSAERDKAGAGNLRHPFVARVGNNMEQFGDAFAPDRRDNAELGKVSSDRVNHRGLLADKQMASTMKHQAALLLGRLCWDEPHVGAGNGFANRFCVSHVVLMPAALIARYGQAPGARVTNGETRRKLLCQPDRKAASEKNANTWLRFNWRRISTWPPASTPWIWKTDLAMSKPIVVIVCMARSSESWEP